MIWNKKWFQYLILVILALIWGSSFILMKKALIHLDDMHVASTRMVIATVAISPLIYRSRKYLSRKYLPWLVFTGLFGNTIPAFLFPVAQTHISSSLTGMLNSLTPLFTLLIGLWVFKSFIHKFQAVGVIFGLLGATVLIWAEGLDFQNSALAYISLAVLGSICYAASVNVLKQKLDSVPALAITALGFLVVFPFNIMAFWHFDSYKAITQTGIDGTGYVIVLAVVCTALALILFNKLIKHTTGIFGASVTYLLPIVAIFWGYFDGEKINTLHIIGIVVVLLGVYLINNYKHQNAN